jgi:hypothetical protein
LVSTICSRILTSLDKEIEDAFDDSGEEGKAGLPIAG